MCLLEFTLWGHTVGSAKCVEYTETMANDSGNEIGAESHLIESSCLIEYTNRVTSSHSNGYSNSLTQFITNLFLKHFNMLSRYCYVLFVMNRFASKTLLSSRALATRSFATYFSKDHEWIEV